MSYQGGGLWIQDSESSLEILELEPEDSSDLCLSRSTMNSGVKFGLGKSSPYSSSELRIPGVLVYFYEFRIFSLQVCMCVSCVFGCGG